MVFSPDISCHDALFRPSFTFCLYISFLFLCFYRYCFVYLSVMLLVLLHYLFIFNSGFSGFFFCIFPIVLYKERKGRHWVGCVEDEEHQEDMGEEDPWSEYTVWSSIERQMTIVNFSMKIQACFKNV